MSASFWQGPIRAEPDFNNVLKVLRRERPDRPTLMELFMNEALDRFVTDPVELARYDGHPRLGTIRTIRAFRNLGYDYATVRASDFGFPRGEYAHKQTLSLNDGALLADRADFENYPWPDPSRFPCERLEECAEFLPPGMKFIVIAPGGVLENAIRLVGYDNLCLLLYDDPPLADDIFAAIGSRLAAYYRLAVQHDAVGAVWANDDWGFKTQTMLAPDEMRRYVIPWHRRIAAVAHAAGRPVVMHSCGCLDAVMEDVVSVIRHDGKHSYEDAICPVEAMYERWSDRIAVIGGIDVDFVCRSTPADVYRRSRAMLERASARGAYALGTGNSVPEYVPRENYFAMLAAAWEQRPGYRLPCC